MALAEADDAVGAEVNIATGQEHTIDQVATILLTTTLVV